MPLVESKECQQRLRKTRLGKVSTYCHICLAKIYHSLLSWQSPDNLLSSLSSTRPSCALVGRVKLTLVRLEENTDSLRYLIGTTSLKRCFLWVLPELPPPTPPKRKHFLGRSYQKKQISIALRKRYHSGEVYLLTEKIRKEV